MTDAPQERKTMKMKINTQNFFERTIEGVNTLQRKIDSQRTQIEIKEDAMAALDEIEEALSDEFGMIDIAFKITASWLNDIADRASELKDEKLITALAGLGITPDSEEKAA